LRIADENTGDSPTVQSVAIFAQMHNVTLWPELRKCVEHVAQAGTARDGQGFSVSLFLSLTNKHEEISKDVQDLRQSSGLAEAGVTVVSNLGADIGQFLQQIQLTKPTTHFDLLLKIHSKSDPGWRRSMLDSMCGDVSHIADIVSKFEKRPEVGMIGPPGHTMTLNRRQHGVSPQVVAYPGGGELQRTYQKIYPDEHLIQGNICLIAGSSFWSRGDPFLANVELRTAIPQMLPLLPSDHKTGKLCTRGARGHRDTGSEGCYIMHSLERVLPSMVKAHYGLEVIPSKDHSWR